MINSSGRLEFCPNWFSFSYSLLACSRLHSPAPPQLRPLLMGVHDGPPTRKADSSLKRERLLCKYTSIHTHSPLCLAFLIPHIKGFYLVGGWRHCGSWDSISMAHGPPHGPWWAPFWTRISRLPESLAPAVPQGAKLEPDQIIAPFYFSL